jgi:hypothetical protein
MEVAAEAPAPLPLEPVRALLLGLLLFLVFLVSTKVTRIVLRLADPPLRTG